jgi:hypothetical protein
VILLGIAERTAALFVEGTWRVEGPGSVSIITREGRDRFAAGDLVLGLPVPT